MSIRKKLKKLIPCKTAFDEACATARAECPQELYAEYRYYGGKNRRFTRKELIRYWSADDTLWEYGYWKYLPQEMIDVFKWWNRE